VIRYASNTAVSRSRSIEEIERTLSRYGADSFGYGWEGDRAVVAFRAHNRMIRLLIPMPKRDDKAFTLTPSGRRRRSQKDSYAEWERACRQRFRVLSLVVKAKLEAVESGLATFEEEFLAYTLLPDGRSVGEMALPEVARAYEKGQAPRFLLPALSSGKGKDDGA
jgi:hypothetical protein